MVVVPEGDASGRFDVYSANDGHNEIYTVDLRTATCECGDYEHRNPAGGCKHIRRVKLGLGIIPLPVGIDPDGCLIDTRTKYGVDVDEAACTSVSEAHPPDSGGRKAVAVVLVAHWPAPASLARRTESAEQAMISPNTSKSGSGLAS